MSVEQCQLLKTLKNNNRESAYVFEMILLFLSRYLSLRPGKTNLIWTMEDCSELQVRSRSF